MIIRPKNSKKVTPEELQASIESQNKMMKEKADFQEKCRQEKMEERRRLGFQTAN